MVHWHLFGVSLCKMLIKLVKYDYLFKTTGNSGFPLCFRVTDGFLSKPRQAAKLSPKRPVLGTPPGVAGQPRIPPRIRA